MATVADHVVSHRGDWTTFMLGRLQSLCDACHNAQKRRHDIDGYDAAKIDANGWPIDPRHPANSGNPNKSLKVKRN